MTGAGSPEELEVLLEDALILQDDAAIASLYDERGVVIHGSGCVPRHDALRLLSPLQFLALPRSVTVVRDVAVVVGDHTVNVSCRGHDGGWRYVVTLVTS
jgi:hypothetical protein